MASELTKQMVHNSEPTIGHKEQQMELSMQKWHKVEETQVDSVPCGQTIKK